MNLEQWLVQLTPSPSLLLLLVMLIALTESLAVVGIVVPGVVMITAAASLAGHQEINALLVMLAAFIGAVIGDGVSYALGYHYRDRAASLWPLSRYPAWLDNGRRFFHRHGAMSILLGRFIGPIRPVIPLVAGIMHMPSRTFLWINIGSALLWAPAYVLPGYLFGRTWQQWQVPSALHPWLIALGITVVVMAILFSLVRHHAYPQGLVHRSLGWLAQRMPHGQRLWQVLAPPHEDHPPLASWLLLVSSFTALSAWTLIVIQADGPLPIDTQLNQLLGGLSLPILHGWSQLLARAGDLLGVVAIAAPWVVWLLIRRHYAALGHVLCGLLGVAALNTLGKEVIGRMRPDAPEHLAHSLSYPSAHTSTAVVLYGMAAAFIAQTMPRSQRFWPYWLAIVIVVPMAISRLILNVHWLSDLIGGTLLGLTVCAMVNLAWLRRPRRQLAPCPLTPLVISSLALLTVRLLWLPPV